MNRSYLPIKKILNLKINCLFINPAAISKELYEEPSFKSKYSFCEWHSDQNSEQLNQILRKKFDFIIIESTNNELMSSEELQVLNNYKLIHNKIYNILSFYEYITGRIPLVHLNKSWLINDDLYVISQRKFFTTIKRFVDIIISLLLLPFGLLFTTIGMLLIKISSQGPVLFKQKRVGKNNKPFTIFKLRTMVFKPSGHNSHTIKDDDRIFPVGKLLRVSKIDELPQLLNVLFGDMSIIGPRPEKVEIVNILSTSNPYYPLRHLIRPGITGWAQVNDPTATPDKNLQKLEFDLYYIKKVSFLLELKILWRTLKIVLTLNSL